MFRVKEATGCSFGREQFSKNEKVYDIREYGAGVDRSAVDNTIAINKAIEEASTNGGGTVTIPSGDYKVYTICLRSGVNLYLSQGSVLYGAKTDIYDAYQDQAGEGGNYCEPEVNPYVGLQDHGHTYFANSLIYGVDISDVMIYGSGLINGSRLDDQGKLEHVLLGGDPFDPTLRSERGYQGEWFGNKAIALVRCKNIGLCDFSILAGGHFAIIATCVTNMYVDGILIDTNRDAFDVDCCENVTVSNSVFNSLTDDALVMKASYGGGIFKPLKNVLIEDCRVSGYDMGSVYDKTYSANKLVATDRCGPTARVKLGTESTCGYDCVTVRRVHFSRSRGFALEAVDGADLSNIIFEDSTMENISSSPIFIKAGDRARFPVTGRGEDETLDWSLEPEHKVRLDQTEWVLPNKEGYTSYPIKRYKPSYNRETEVSIDGVTSFNIVDQDNACRINNANYHCESGKYYGYKYNETKGDYEVDYNKEIEEENLVLYANGVGSDHKASVHHIIIRNIKIDDVDPRYPIELMGMVDSPLSHILIENIELQYRGGLSMEHAVEQRQVNTNWTYCQGKEKEKHTQSIPWLVNTFFLKNEGLLPRVEWNQAKQQWQPAPFNVPEMTDVYPEPSNWGILPAYGLYARHVEGLYIKDIRLSYLIEDSRHPMVLDDVKEGFIEGVKASHAEGIEMLVLVKNHYKRPSGSEYVPNHPYETTKVKDVKLDTDMTYMEVEVNAPAPGTPHDDLYPYKTVATPKTGYQFHVESQTYPLPQTVYRPFFNKVLPIQEKAKTFIEFDVVVRQPAYEVSQEATDSKIYNETLAKGEPSSQGIKTPMTLRVEHLPVGASFDPHQFVPGSPCTFTWQTDMSSCGVHDVTFIADDGIIPVRMNVQIIING